MTGYFVTSGRAAICVEFSGQYGWWPQEVSIGERAMQNWFRFLKMLSGGLEGQDEPVVWLNDVKKEKITAPHDGLFIPTDLHLSEPVCKNDLLGYLLDDEKLVQTEFRAPEDGYLYQHSAVRGMNKAWSASDQQITLHPYCTKGETIAVVVHK